MPPAELDELVGCPGGSFVLSGYGQVLRIQFVFLVRSQDTFK